MGGDITSGIIHIASSGARGSLIGIGGYAMAFHLAVHREVYLAGAAHLLAQGGEPDAHRLHN